MTECEKLADEMAEAAIYYFKIQETAPKKPDAAYWRVRARAKQLLRTAVNEYRKKMKKDVA